MKTIVGVFACMTLTAVGAMADTQVFRGILGSASNVQRDAEIVSRHLKSKNASLDEVKSHLDSLGSDIAAMRKAVEDFEATHPNLSAAQKKDWELVKMKVQLLSIFYDRKSELVQSGEMNKNRSMIRAHADGLAKRAAMLQQTLSRMDR